MGANDRQVAGDHYKSAYQHWDFVEDLGVPYLAAAALKYASRWRNKNGLQDLEKALHFMYKLIETEKERISVAAERARLFIDANKLGWRESRVVLMLSRTRSNELAVYVEARETLRELVTAEADRRRAAMRSAQEEVDDAFATKGPIRG